MDYLYGKLARASKERDSQPRWHGVYELAVEGLPGESRQVIPIRVQLFSPDHTLPKESAKQSAPFGSDEWQCYLPELRLRCETEPPEQALEILPQLVDPEGSRALLERRRLELWETWDYLRDALHIWTKPKPEGAQAVIRILEYQLERMGWLS